MHSFIFSASFEFAFAAILFVFHQSQDLVPRSSHSLSWPPFWINFHSPWTNQSRDFCCVPGSSLLPPPYWKARRLWGRGWLLPEGARSNPKSSWLNRHAVAFRRMRIVAWSSVNKAQTFWTTVMYRRCKRILKGSVTALLLSGSLLVIFFITMEKHSLITLRTQPDDIVAKDATALNVHSTCSTGGWITICFS